MILKEIKTLLYYVPRHAENFDISVDFSNSIYNFYVNIKNGENSVNVSLYHRDFLPDKNAIIKIDWSEWKGHKKLTDFTYDIDSKFYNEIKQIYANLNSLSLKDFIKN